MTQRYRIPGGFLEADWGRKTVRSKTFIGRVREYDANGEGGIVLCECQGHAHPAEASAEECAATWAVGHARQLNDAYQPPDLGALRQAVHGMLGDVRFE